MNPNTSTSPLNLTSYLGKGVNGFTGREWIFHEIDEWLGESRGSRYFLLLGEPGSGKSAIATRLAQFSRNIVLPPDNISHLTPDFLSAIYFCLAQDSRLLSPYTFSETLAAQLAQRHVLYAQSLIEIIGRQNISLSVEQGVQQVEGGQVAGIIINSLNINGLLPPPEDVFNQLVRKPLDALFANGFDQQIVVLIDALDETLHYSGAVSILSLLAKVDKLPHRVRFIVTSRHIGEVLRTLRHSQSIKEHNLSSGSGLSNSYQDAMRYIVDNIGDVSQKSLVSKLPVDLSTHDFAKIVQERSGGNFLYIRYLLKMLADQEEVITLETLSKLPTGLDNIYTKFLDRLMGEDNDKWEQKYKPIVGTLAVAQEALSEKQLAGFVNASETSVRKVLTDLRQFLQSDDFLPPSRRTYTLYHRSFADFLLDTDRADMYWCKASEQHQHIIHYYRKSVSTWKELDWHTVDDYGLLYLASHMYVLSDQEAGRQELYGLICKTFMQEKLVRTGSHRSFAENVALAIEVANRETAPDLLQAIRCSLIYATVGSMATNIPPEALIVLAQRGLIARALSVAGLMQNQEKQSQAYLLMSESLFAQQRTDEANNVLHQGLTAIESIGDKATQVKMLVKAIKVLLAIDDQEQAKIAAKQALKAANAIFARKEKVETLEELAEGLARLGLLEQAVNAVTMIGNQQDKARVLKNVAITVAQSGKFDQALIIAEHIKSQWGKATALIEIAQICGQEGLVDRACEVAEQAAAVINNIYGWEAYVDAQNSIGKLFIQLEMYDHANHAINEAIGGIEKFSNSGSKVEALTLIVRTLQFTATSNVDSTTKLIRYALTRAQRCEDEYEKAHAMEVIVNVLTDMKQLDQAIELAKQIEVSWNRFPALGYTAQALIGAQRYDEAMDIALLMTADHSDTSFDYPLRKVSEAFAYAGRLEQAMDTAQLLVDDEEQPLWQKAHTLREICRTLCQRGEFKQAIEIARFIEDPFVQRDTFNLIAQELAQTEQIDQAIMVAQEGDSVVALSMVANILVQKGYLDQAEAVVNRVLLIAETIDGELTKANALDSFALVLAEHKHPEQAIEITNQTLAIIKTITYEDSKIDLFTGATALLLRLQQNDDASLIDQVVDAARSFKDPLNTIHILKELAHILVDIGKLDQAEILANEALRLAEARHDERIIALTLVEVAYILYTREEIEQGEDRASQAVNVVKSIKKRAEKKKAQVKVLRGESDKVQSLYKIAQVLLIINEPTRACKIARRVADIAQRIEGDPYPFRQAVQVLAQTEQFDRAILLAESSDDPSEKIIALSGIAYILAQAKQFERARSIAMHMDHPLDKVITLGRIARMLALIGNLMEAQVCVALAQEVTSSIDDEQLRREAWSEVVRILADIGQTTQALALLRDIETASSRIEILIQVSSTLLRQKKSEQALQLVEQIIQAMEGVEDKDVILKEIADIQSEAGQFEQAEQSILKMRDRVLKAQAIRSSVYQLSKRGSIEQALTKAKAMKTDWYGETIEKALAFTDIATLCIQRGAREQGKASVEQALKVSELLFDEQEQVDVLNQMTGMIVAADVLDQVFERMENMANENKARILTALAQALVQKGQKSKGQELLEKALEATNSIEDPQILAERLIEIAYSLFQHGLQQRARTIANQAIVASEKIGRQKTYTENLLKDIQVIVKVVVIGVEIDNSDQVEDVIGLVEELMGIIEGIEEWAHHVILIECARALAACKAWDRFDTVIHDTLKLIESFNSARDKVEVLSQVASILFQARREERAKEIGANAFAITASIEDEQERIVALAQIAPVLLQTGQIDEARTAIQYIKERTLSPEVANKVIELLADMNQFDQALAEVEKIHYRSVKGTSLRYIAHTLAQADKVDQATALAEQALDTAEIFGDEEDEAFALYEIASLHQRIGEQERAKAFVEQALIIAQSIGDDLEKESSSPLRRDEELRIMKYRKTKIGILSKLAILLTILQETERACEIVDLIKIVISTITIKRIQIDAWSDFLPLLLHINDEEMMTFAGEQLEAIMNVLTSDVSIEYSEQDEEDNTIAIFTNYALVDLYYVLERAGYYNQAGAVLDAVDASRKGSDSLRKIVYAFIHFSRHIDLQETLVQETIEAIKDAWHKTDALTKFANVLYNLEKKDKALEILNQAVSLIQTASGDSAETTSALSILIKEDGTIKTVTFTTTVGNKISALTDIAQVAIRMEAIELAENILNSLSRMVTETKNSQEQAYIQRQIVVILITLGQIEKALVSARTIRSERVKALALINVARALQKTEKPGKIMLIIREAFNAARLAGRDSVLESLEQSGDILGALDQGRTVWRLYETLQEVDSWWGEWPHALGLEIGH